ncbi:MAG: CPBP family intramembrane metalloprotease [Clostridiales bacterium]|jgi:membrane protease YdiL (CAAX protease family)|nr:CPBP family intramembrane metalloprotease [Clostridiales bacterium]
MNNSLNVKQMGIGEILCFHLLPGIPILVIVILLSNPACGAGLPILLSVLLAIPLGLAPAQLGVLYFAARKENKKIKDIIPFTEKMSAVKTFLWVLPLLIFAALVYSSAAPFERPLWTIFDWAPQWFRLDKFSPEGLSKEVLILIAVLNITLNGLLAPFVEELYFRGFLLPRMNILGKMAPLCNTALFSLYHFITPWEFFTRILAITPYTYAVWYKKSLRLGILHPILNTLNGIVTAIIILR